MASKYVVDFRLDPEKKRLWVEALRSGKYQQGFGKLRTDDFEQNGTPLFCCLGVLCDISGLGTWRVDEPRQTAYVIGNNIVEDLPPRAVWDWAGLTARDVRNPPVEHKNLSDWNDGTYVQSNGQGQRYGTASFDEIADLIEKYL